MIAAEVYRSDFFVSDDATDNAPTRGIQQSAIFDVELLQSVSDSQANNMTRAIHHLEQSIRRQKCADCSSASYPKLHALKKQLLQLTTRAFAAHGQGKFLEEIVAHLRVAAK
jgi:hypothetical protein